MQGVFSSSESNISETKCSKGHPGMGTALVLIVGLAFYGLFAGAVVWILIDLMGRM